MNTTYRANTKQGVPEFFSTEKGDVYAVYISTKWAVKNGLDLLEVVRTNEKTGKSSVVFDVEN